MLHAELRGKAAPEDQHAEDALTSTVFGTLFTAGDAALPILHAWLGHARPADAATPAWPAGLAGPLDYWFWPRLREAEPDVVIAAGTTLVVVEAKFHSGKSGSAAVPARDADSAGAASGAPAPSDQLLREWRSILSSRDARDRAAPSRASADAVASIDDAIAGSEQRVLVYLVKRSHAVKAAHELAASLAAAGAASPRPALYLLHWEHLDEVLTAAASDASRPAPRWQRELRAYLRHRRIAAFRGFAAAFAATRTDTDAGRDAADPARLATWRATWRPRQGRWPYAFAKQDMPWLAALAGREARYSSRSR